jgi:hypothetical protein
MLAILLELAICLAIGAAAAYFLTASTSWFLIVLTLVAIGLWVIIRVARHIRSQDVADLTLFGILEAIFFWWT